MAIGEKRLEKLPDDLWIEAENSEGHRYGMTVQTFKEVYQGQGYKITARGDGLPLLEGNEVNTAETQTPASQQVSPVVAEEAPDDSTGS